MSFIEAPTTFYLGRRYNPQTKSTTPDVVYYDSRDLTTHAVVVGMTGSGKTGLCVNLLEEAIIDNIPSIIIDPKGDITNLMLNFPTLQPTDFAPWIHPDDSRRAGMNEAEYAGVIAKRWRDGLQDWGIVADRLKWAKLAAKYSIYTPGSDAGLPISILASLRAPREGFHMNEEGNRERINGIATALLALIGKKAKPTEDEEHVLLANIFEYNWRQGRDLTMEDLIIQVQRPPFDQLGVLPLENYITEKRRYKLAMDLNSIIAAPSFQSWLQGEPLDIQSLLYQPVQLPTGEVRLKPRVSIFYIAHLSQPERDFILTLILENLLAWMRLQNGTSSLRAILYIDEMFGYFPPYPQNPPTKDPILRLLKQARAFGLGLVLATQNPGDLDYKGLSNAGTWFIGRLQSDNDKRKVMNGLEALAANDAKLNLGSVDTLISELNSRVFLMHNVHNQSGPQLMMTRWTMSYLSGPLTRQQIKLLMAPQRAQLMQTMGYMPPQQGYGLPPQAPAMGGYGVPQGYPPMMQAQAAYGAPPPVIPGATTGYGVQPFPVAPPPMIPGYGQQAPMGYPPQTGYPQQPSYPPAPGYPPQGYGQGASTFGAQSAPTPQQAGISLASVPQGYGITRPAIPNGIQQYFVPEALNEAQAVQKWEQQTNFSARGATPLLAYKPKLVGQASIRYQDKKTAIFTDRTYSFHIEELPRTGLIHWEQYVVNTHIDERRLSGEPLRPNVLFGNVPIEMLDPKRIKSLEGEMVDMLYNTANLTVPMNPTLSIYGDPNKEFSVFQAAVQQAAREGRDAEVDKLTEKFEKLMDRLDDKLRKKNRELKAEKKELTDRKREELFTAGEAFISILNKRYAYTLSRASSVSRQRRQTKEDLDESNEVILEIEQEIAQIEQQFEAELNKVNEKWVGITNQVQDYLVTPYKKDIHVELFGITWIPNWYVNVNGQQVFLNAL